MNARSRQIGWVIVGVLIGIVVTQTLLAAYRTDETVATIEAAQRDNAETLALVKSCTQPGHDCYDRSKRQTAKAIASINQITILAAACAAGPEVRSVPEIQACVLRRLDRPRG